MLSVIPLLSELTSFVVFQVAMKTVNCSIRIVSRPELSYSGEQLHRSNYCQHEFDMRWSARVIPHSFSNTVYWYHVLPWVSNEVGVSLPRVEGCAPRSAWRGYDPLL